MRTSRAGTRWHKPPDSDPVRSVVGRSFDCQRWVRSDPSALWVLRRIRVLRETLMRFIGQREHLARPGAAGGRQSRRSPATTTSCTGLTSTWPNGVVLQYHRARGRPTAPGRLVRRRDCDKQPELTARSPLRMPVMERVDRGPGPLRASRRGRARRVKSALLGQPGEGPWAEAAPRHECGHREIDQVADDCCPLARA
jgi:hypothetical protein